MKQTNNALKFLLAQYRAIFKNAYFKGLTTALVVTAGLAAGQAQANTGYLYGDTNGGSSPKWQHWSDPNATYIGGSFILVGQLAGDNVGTDPSLENNKATNIASGGKLTVGNYTFGSGNGTQYMTEGAVAGNRVSASGTDAIAQAIGGEVIVNGSGYVDGTAPGRGVIDGGRANSAKGTAIASDNTITVFKDVSARSKAPAQMRIIGGRAEGLKGATANGNIVDIKGDTNALQVLSVSGTEGILGGVAISMASATGTYEAKDNKVILDYIRINDTTKALQIHGGRTALMRTNVSGSSVLGNNSIELSNSTISVSGGEVVANHLQGSNNTNILSAIADGNDTGLVIENSTVTTSDELSIVGTLIEHASTVSSTANNTKVTISNTNLAGASGDIHIAAACVESSGNITSTGNTVEITEESTNLSNGSYTRAIQADVYGTYLETAATGATLSAKDNSVTIGSNASVTGDVFGAAISGSSVKDLNADNNTVTIAGKVTGNVAATTIDPSFTLATSGTASFLNNKVILEAGADVQSGSLYGGAGKDSLISIEDGATYIVDTTNREIESDVINIAGTVDIKGGGLTLQGFASDRNQSGKYAPNLTTITSSAKIKNAGTLTILGKTVVEDGANLWALNPAAAIAVDGTSANQLSGDALNNVLIPENQVADAGFATLNLTSNTLKSYLDGGVAYDDADPKKQTSKGAVTLTSGGRLELSDAQAFDLADYVSGSGATLGKIGVNDGVIAGNNLVVSRDINGASKLTVDATLSDSSTLTLGGGKDFKSAEKSLGFEEAIARNVVFNADATAVGGKTFTLHDKLTLKATKEITNPYNSDVTNFVYADEGKITGSVIVSGAQPLTVAAGHFTDDDSITLASGNLVVGGQTNDIDATLKLNGALLLDNSKGANTITIKGNGTVNFKDDVTPKKQRYAEAGLDISEGVLDISGGSAFTTIDVAEAGYLIVNEEQIANILNINEQHNGTRRSNKGAGVLLEQGGTLSITGNLQGDLNRTALNVNKLKSGTTATTDTITFKNGGTVEADSMWLVADDNAKANLNIGSGTLATNSLSLYQDFTISHGNLIVGEALSADYNDRKLTLNDGSISLGYIEENDDEWGIGNGTYSTSSEHGSVAQNLILSGTLAKGEPSAYLDVNYGTWDARDITINTGRLTVGEFNERNNVIPTDSEGNTLNATLNANNLTLANANASVQVNRNGSANFQTLTVSNGTVNVNGQMTVEGAHEADTTAYGVAITGGNITVSGPTAQLTFGEAAASAISVSDDKVTIATDTFKSNIKVQDFATLKLDFTENGYSFTIKTLQDLRKGLLYGSNGKALRYGYLDLGNASISGLELDKDGYIDYTQFDENFKDIKGISDILTEEMSHSTLTNVTGGVPIEVNVGNIRANGGTNKVLLGNTILSDATAHNDPYNNFIFNSTNPSKALDADIDSGAHVRLANGGNIGNVNLLAGKSADADDITIFNVLSSGAATNIASLTAGDNTLISIQGATNVAGSLSGDDLVVDQALEVKGDKGVVLTSNLSSTPITSEDGETTTLTTTGKLTAQSLSVAGETNYGGSLDIAGDATFDGKAVLAGEQNTFAKTVNFKNDVEFINGTTTAGTMVLAQASDANPLNVFVGSDDYSGFLSVGRLDLNGGTLIADPAFGQNASLVAVGQLGKSGAATEAKGNAAGELQGKLVALQNSIIGVGVSNTEETSALEQLRQTFTDYGYMTSGSLSADNVGAIAYVAKALDIAVDATNSNQIIVDAKSLSDYEKAVAADTYKDAQIYLGDNSALAINLSAATDSLETVTVTTPEPDEGEGDSSNADGSTNDNSKATTQADTTKQQRAAIKFTGGEATLAAGENAKLILVGDYSVNKPVMLFSDDGRNGDDGKFVSGSEGVTIKGNDVTVNSKNGLLIGTLEADQEYVGINLEVNPDVVPEIYKDASNPVKQSLIDYAAYLAAGGTEVNGFLEDIIKNDASGADAEKVARAGAYAGAAQVALTAGATTYDAVSGRMGVGANGTNITVADNTQGAALWLTPVYRNSDSDGFGAQGVEYGVDLDLYGVALGADYTLANGVKVGAAFNIGSGDADGNGAGDGVKNDFDYYGFAIYGGYTYGPYSVVADISYTTVDNDVEINTAKQGKGVTSFDSSNFSLGVTGQYQAILDGDVSVTPHVGLRYTKIDFDDYEVKGSEEGDGVAAKYAADDMSVFSIPFGVTVAKEFVNGTWTVKPSFDLTLTANFGDDEMEGTTNWVDAGGLSTKVSSEVLDNFTYGATVGVAAKSGNFSLGFGLNYTGSSNTDEFGVNANARFVF